MGFSKNVLNIFGTTLFLKFMILKITNQSSPNSYLHSPVLQGTHKKNTIKICLANYRVKLNNRFFFFSLSRGPRSKFNYVISCGDLANNNIYVVGNSLGYNYALQSNKRLKIQEKKNNFGHTNNNITATGVAVITLWQL